VLYEPSAVLPLLILDCREIAGTARTNLSKSGDFTES
jgi:hypothetical protein